MISHFVTCFLTSLSPGAGTADICVSVSPSYRAQTDWSPLSGPGSVGLRMDASVSRLQSQAQSAGCLASAVVFTETQQHRDNASPGLARHGVEIPAWPSLASGEETPGRVCVQAVMVKAGLPLPYLPPPSLPLLSRLG